MAGVEHSRLGLHVTVAFTFVLSAWVSRSMGLNLYGLGKNLHHTGVEATVAGGRRGKILFDGKDLELQVEPSSAAASGKLLKIILGQLTQSDSTYKETAWKHLKPSLHCGQNEMQFRATGHRAADMQLDIGAADPLPLNQVPKTCGYTMRKSVVDFVLAVSYDGCNMIQENGNYVLKMRWLNASVELICSMMVSSKLPDPYASQSSQEPESFPVRTWRPKRQKRDVTGQLYYDPRSLHYYYACLYYYNMYMMNLMHAFNTRMPIMASPQVPTTIANPPRDASQIPHYGPYYNPYYYQAGNAPMTVPQPPACDSNTGVLQCSQDPPGKTKFPFYPSSRPTQQMFPGSPLLQQYHGKNPYQPLPPLPGKPYTSTTQELSPAPATAAPTPCPSQEGSIGASCLGAVDTYVPNKNLTFQPYISYEMDKPAEYPQKIPLKGLDSMSGAPPRAFPNYGSYVPALVSPFFENPVMREPLDYNFY